jgi:hypothetical protein
MAASDLLIRISADGKSFFPTIEKMNRETRVLTESLGQLDKITTGIGGLAGALGIKAISDSIDELVERADTIKDRANALGLSNQTVQKISNVTDFDQARSGLEKLADAQQRVLTGDDKDFKVVKAFAELGVTLDDLKKKNFQQLFDQIADSTERAAISGAKLTALKDILGKGGGRLVEGFQKGFNGGQANSFLLDDSQIKQLGDLKDMKRSVGGFWSELGAIAKVRLSQIEIGLLSLPDSARYILSDPVALSRDAQGNAKAKANQSRLDIVDSEKAKKQVEAAEAAEKEKKAQEDAKKIQEKAGELKQHNEERLNRLYRDGLSIDQRKLQISKERKLLQDQILKETDPIKREQLVNRDLDLMEENNRIKPSSQKSITLAHRPDADELAKIGLFRGGYDRTQSIQEKSERHLKNAVDELRKLNHTAEEP